MNPLPVGIINLHDATLLCTTASGFVQEAEPELPELAENYVMVFRPMTEDENAVHLSSGVGAGWASTPLPAAPNAP